ncbi:MAG: pyruvate kinase, partial [Candidatus Ranarchaeia archaeon]
VKLNIGLPTEKDEVDIKLGIKHEVDWFAISFIRDKNDLKRTKAFIQENGGDIPIISKIEHGYAIKNFLEILEHSDGIMVARGDLGIETPPEELPILQKRIIRQCNDVGKPVIVATQMLESMIKNPKPTRAEVNDVANAILDGADATMLSAETAIGKYPIKSARIMNRIERVAEKEIFPEHIHLDTGRTLGTTEVVGEMVAFATKTIKPSAIFVLTRSGFSARMISKTRVPVQILTVAASPKIKRQLQLLWGIKTLDFKWYDERDKTIEQAVLKALEEKYILENDKIIVVSASPFDKPGRTNAIDILNCKTIIEKKIDLGR